MQREGPLNNGRWTLGIPDEVLGTFSKGLWHLHVLEKIKLLWWQISHNMVLVGEWLGKHGGSIVCPLYFAPTETMTLFVGLPSSSKVLEQGDSPPSCLRSGRDNIVERNGLDQPLS